MNQTHQEYDETTLVLAERIIKRPHLNSIALVVHEVMAEEAPCGPIRRAMAVFRSLQESNPTSAEMFYHKIAHMEERYR